MRFGFGGRMSAGRRDFLKQACLMGSMAMMAALPEGARAFTAGNKPIIEDAALAGQSDELPKHAIKCGVCGMSHDHIYGMMGAIQRGGGTLVAAWGGEDDKIAAFAKRFPD